MGVTIMALALIMLSLFGALIHSETDDYSWMCITGTVIGSIMLFCGNIKKTQTNIKVKELKENTVFMLKDSTNLYSEGDTIRVDLKTIKVSIDSNSVKCIVLKLKNK